MGNSVYSLISQTLSIVLGSNINELAESVRVEIRRECLVSLLLPLCDVILGVEAAAHQQGAEAASSAQGDVGFRSGDTN